MSDFDVIILGGGIAGLTAGLTAGRFGLRTAVIDKSMAGGGQIVTIEKIENFPGFPEGISGFDLGPIVLEQAEKVGVEFRFDTVEGIEAAGDERIVRCESEQLTAKAVIVATGSSLRKLGIPGEDNLFGKGISNCASCDGPFFRDQPVGVVGGGDAAFDEADLLTTYASQVTVFHRSSDFRAQKTVLDKARSKSNLKVATFSEVIAVQGSDGVTGVEVRDTRDGSTRVEPLSGLFIFVGLNPNTEFLRDTLELDSSGHIVTDIMMRTSLEGVFAAGDVRKDSVAQLASVAGDGSTAAVAAGRYIAGLK